MHNIVVVGGNIAGVPAAHYLIRHVLPRVNPANDDKPQYTVTLVSPSDHTFFKIGAPRALFSEDQSLLNKPFASIRDAFSHYNSLEFTFVQGEAVQLDETAKSISVKLTNDTKLTSIHYDSLVIATGTTSASPLWTLHGDHQITKDASTEIFKLLVQAQTILVAGGGPAGVETVGEIAYQYISSGKEIILLSGGTRLLPRLKNQNAAKTAETKLAALNVKVIHQIKVSSSTKLSNGRTSLTLSDGTIRVVDVYIDATGGKPNTNFLPASWLDNSKRVVADKSTLRATQAPAGVYSIGDVASFSMGNIMDAGWVIPALGYSIWFDLHENTDGWKGHVPAITTALKEKKYKQIEVDMQVIPISPKGGVGVLFGWQIPNFLVWLIKSRTFMLESAPGLATGASVMKA